MISRKQFLLRGLAAGAMPGLLQAASSEAEHESYEAAARRIWQPTVGAVGDSLALRHELVRYATLAPSSHNTQCWKFHVEEDKISILPDFARRTPAVDPDDHHLVVSLGCAAENLVQAALANGLQGEVRFDAGMEVGAATGATGAIQVTLEPTKAVLSPLFQAIPERQCTRSEFDGQPLSQAELKLLELAGTGTGVRVLLLTEKRAMEQVLAYVVQGNTAQMRDAAFVRELKSWIRFGGDEAVRSGDGLYSAASGNPSLPRWLGSLLFGLFFTEEGENDKYAKQVRSSAGIAIFVSDADDRTHWIEAGRCYERFALQATALGIRNAMLNQAVEVAQVRKQFATHLGIGSGRPDLVVRFGQGPKMPRSLRRPLQAVLA